MKPTFRLHFSAERPKKPGLWLNRRRNFIGVLQVEASDIERALRDDTWLDGEWGALIELTDRDTVPLDPKQVQEHLDKLINGAHQAAKAETLVALQALRQSLLGSSLELPESASPEPEGQEPARDYTD